MTPQELTEQFSELSKQITALNSQSTALGKEKAEIEKELIHIMEDLGTTTLKNSFGNFRINEAELPQVEDWEKVYKFVADNDAFYLLQKRIGSIAYKELLDAGETVPGINTYTKKTISLRKS